MRVPHHYAYLLEGTKRSVSSSTFQRRPVRGGDPCKLRQQLHETQLREPSLIRPRRIERSSLGRTLEL